MRAPGGGGRPWLTLSARGDYVRGTNTTRDEPLPLMPRCVRWPAPKSMGRGRSADAWAYLGGEVEHVAAPDRLNPLDYDVGAYTLLNFDAGVRGTWMGRDVVGEPARAQRRFGEYKDFLSRYKRFALNPGRDMC